MDLSVKCPILLFLVSYLDVLVITFGTIFFSYFTDASIAFIFLVPSAAPVTLSLIHRDSRSIIVHWDPIPEGSENGVLNGYKVEYWAKRHNKTAVCETSHDEYTAVLDGLWYNTVYTIRVAAFTGSGSGDFSEPILVETKMCKLRFIDSLNHHRLFLSSVCPISIIFVFITPVISNCSHCYLRACNTELRGININGRHNTLHYITLHYNHYSSMASSSLYPCSFVASRQIYVRKARFMLGELRNFCFLVKTCTIG